MTLALLYILCFLSGWFASDACEAAEHSRNWRPSAGKAVLATFALYCFICLAPRLIPLIG